MIKVNGGLAYINLKQYGQLTSGEAVDAVQNEYEQASQLEKLVIVVGLDLKTVGVFGAFPACFVVSSGTATADLPNGAGTIAITSAGKITVTKAAAPSAKGGTK